MTDVETIDKDIGYLHQSDPDKLKEVAHATKTDYLEDLAMRLDEKRDRMYNHGL